MPTQKRPKPRLTPPSPDQLTEAQKKLRDAIASGPRGEFRMEGPFGIYMEAPEYGLLAQALGGHVRLRTSVAPRLSETAILCTARHWRAQYEWFAHAIIAEKQGVKPATIKSIYAGRRPKTAPKDELAIYDFVKELYADRRVSDATYKKVQKLLGNQGAVELVGICGYYAMISMQLNVFRAPLPPGQDLFFKE
jgi:4-carboxymuconolactone decarboxylase